MTGAYGTDRGLTNDEAAHFVNGLLIFDYLRQGLSSSPMAFARDYYAHLPRVSIGHWPPAFYVLEASAFALAGRSAWVSVALQALIAGAAAGTAAKVVCRRAGVLAGLATGLAVIASPTLMFLLDAVMLDTAVALLVLGAALAWARFARRSTLGRAAVFAAFATAAILTKGNGFGLALLPVIHAALSWDVRPVRAWQAWAAAAAVALGTLPWHLATFRMQSSGFNYAFGWDYTSRAVPFYALAALEQLGPIVLTGLVTGLSLVIRPRPGEPRDETLTALAAGALAMAAFALVAPADLSPRYLVPVIPCATAVAAVGLVRFARRAGAGPRLAGAAVSALLLLNAAALLHLPHTANFGTREIAKRILTVADSPMVLAAGSPRAEGALIAAFAELDPMRTHYVLRASQQLASGNFMGDHITLRFSDASQTAAWLQASGICWVVLDRSAESLAMKQDAQLSDVMGGPPEGWTLVETWQGADGRVDLFGRPGARPTEEQMRGLLARAVPNG